MVDLLARSLGIALGLALAVGCSSTDPSGPLEKGNGVGNVCSPVAADGSMTYGFEVLVNSATTPAVIDSVALVEPVGLSMIEARLVTFEDAHREGVTLTGVGPGYPPEKTGEWAGSVTAVGAAIAPANTSSEVFNLVVGLEMHGDVDAATASALDIAYRVGSRNYVFTTNNDIALVRDTCP